MKVNDESTQYQAMWLSLLQATGTWMKVNKETKPQQPEVNIFFTSHWHMDEGYNEETKPQ